MTKYHLIVLGTYTVIGGIQLNKMSIMAIMAAMFLFVSMVPVATAENGSGDSTGISITDSRDVTTNLTGPAVHVAAFGAFATNTLVDIGQLQKAVIFDASSEYSKSGIEEVKNYSADMFITVSSANKDMVVQIMLGMADNGTWNKTTDVIFGYGYSYLATVWSELEGYGFHVITFYPNSYDGIVQVVEDIETVVGADHAVSENMAYVKSYIGETLLEKGVNETSEKVTAVYVSYSSSVYKLGNGGSVTVDFINFAGGNNIANDTSKAVPTYSVDLTAIVQLSPEFVLLDGYYTGSAADFSTLLGDDSIQVYKMNKTWNTYSPDAAVGLWTVASLFYPQYFEGEVPVEPSHDNEGDNTMLYLVVGAGVVLVAVVAVVFLRRGNK
jgi:ABC-type Fe3+-hydroxamate transport system substrate-binding protein